VYSRALQIRGRFAMHPIRLFAALLAGVALLGCASTSISNRQEYQGEKLARPEHIIVQDFAATAAEVPLDSAFAGRIDRSSPPPTATELEFGRELGAQVAEELVSDIQAMGIPAVRAVEQPMPQRGDLVIRGYFASVDEGSAAKRMAIGFGSGAAELTTLVEGYLMTDQGLRRLGSGEVTSGGGKSPGVLIPLAVTIATANPIGLVVGGAVKVAGEATGYSTIEGSARRTADEIAGALKPKFQEQGWIE
jgi:hypothetical protein